MPISLKFAHTLNAPAAAVYRAFSNAIALREWLADVASIDPRPAGRFFLAWNSGYYAAGEFVNLIQDKEINLIWSGRDDPAPTRVHIGITPLDSGLTGLVLEHTHLNNQGAWAAAFRRIERGWAGGLLNLKSVLEDGPDLRIVNRPMMGILFGESNKNAFSENADPAAAGVRIESVVDGLGAQSAGLKRDDLITSLEGKAVSDFSTLLVLLQDKQAGEKVEVGFTRAGEKRKVSMELARRPIPEVPMTAGALTAALAKAYTAGMELLTRLLTSVQDETASRRPAAAEWSIHEVPAHLIHNERDIQVWVSELVCGQDRTGDSYGSNLPARVQATAAVYGSIKDLLDQLQRSQAETLALITGLPDAFVANKASFWRMAYQLIEDSGHIREHAAQIQAQIK